MPSLSTPDLSNPIDLSFKAFGLGSFNMKTICMSSFQLVGQAGQMTTESSHPNEVFATCYSISLVGDPTRLVRTYRSGQQFMKPLVNHGSSWPALFQPRWCWRDRSCKPHKQHSQQCNPWIISQLCFTSAFRLAYVITPRITCCARTQHRLKNTFVCSSRWRVFSRARNNDKVHEEQNVCTTTRQRKNRHKTPWKCYQLLRPGYHYVQSQVFLTHNALQMPYSIQPLQHW